MSQMTFVRLVLVTIALQQYFDIEAFIRFGAITNRIPVDNRYILEPLSANGRESNRESSNQSYERRNNNNGNSINQNRNSATNNNIKPKTDTPKPKEQTHQMVQRTIPLTDRPPLSDFKVGQKCRGTIMSIVKHGFFIDIGTSKDGLAHVSDISKDYFIQNIMSKYSPGQQVDVWIKFVDPATSKLGLQMFPVTSTTTTAPTTSSTGTTTSANTATSTPPIQFRKPAIFFPSESRINGTIVKVSDLGVFVDIGANVDAFLPKRKMKLSKKQMKFKPWEVHPLNSKMTGYVHEIDRSKNRISLTTYEPTDWQEKMPNKDYIISAQRSMIEDDEELGGSTRKSNARSLENTLAMNVDDEDEDEEDNIFDAEELSMEEINRLTGGKRKAQLLIDDDDDDDTATTATTTATDKKKDKTDKEKEDEVMKVHTDNNYEAEEEISTEELFNELRKSKPYLTYKEVKKWDYLQDFMENEEINDVQIKELIHQCGGNGKLDVEQFDVFIDLLVNFLGLKEVGDDDYDENDAADETDTDDNNDEEDEDEDDFVILDDFEASTFNTSVISMKTAVKEAAAVESSSSESSMTHKISATATTAAAEEEGSVDEVEELEQLVSMGSKGLGFGKSNYKTNSNINSSSSGGGDASSSGGNSANTMSLEEHFNKKSGTNDLLQYVFNDVAGKKGHVLIDDILRWDFTIALIEQTKNNKGENYVDEKKVRSIYSKLCTRKDRKADRVIFEKILDELSRIETLSSTSTSPTTTNTDTDVTTSTATATTTTSTMSATAPVLKLPKGTAVLKSTNEFIKTEPEYLHQNSVTIDENSLKNKNIGPNGKYDYTSDEYTVDEDDFETLFGDEEMIDEKDSGEYEEISVEDAFNEIAVNNAKFITFEALCEWEMVAELIQDEVISEENLEVLYREAGAKKGKLDLEGFHVFLDLLAPYGEDGDEEEEDYEVDEDKDYEGDGDVSILMDDTPAAVKKTSTNNNSKSTTTNAKQTASKTTSPSSTAATTSAPVTAILSPEEAESLDDDTILANVFQGLAGVKSYVSLKDLLNWDFVLDLFSEGLLDEEMLIEKMKECGANKKGLNLESFDRMVDTLVEMYGDADDDEEDDDDEEEEMEVIKATTPGGGSKNTKQSSSAVVVEEEDDDDDILDIDVAGSFATLSQGKTFVTIPSFKNWAVITRLLDEGHLQPKDVDAILAAADVDYKNKSMKMNLETFERVIDELANLFSGYEEEEEGSEDDDEDEDEDDDEDSFSEDDDIYEENNQQLMQDLKAVIEKEEAQQQEGKSNNNNSKDGKPSSGSKAKRGKK